MFDFLQKDDEQQVDRALSPIYRSFIIPRLEKWRKRSIPFGVFWGIALLIEYFSRASKGNWLFHSFCFAGFVLGSQYVNHRILMYKLMDRLKIQDPNNLQVITLEQLEREHKVSSRSKIISILGIAITTFVIAYFEFHHRG